MKIPIIRNMKIPRIKMPGINKRSTKISHAKASGMKIRTKMLIGVGLLIGLLLVSQTVSYIGREAMVTSYQRIQDDSKISFTMKSIQFHLTALSNDERGFLLTGDETFVTEAKAEQTAIVKELSTMKQLSQDPENLKAVADIQKLYINYLLASDHTIEAYRRGDKAGALDIHLNDAKNARKALDPVVEGYMKKLDASTAADQAQAQSDAAKQTVIMLIIAVISVLIGLATGYVLIRSINKPLQFLQKRVRAIAAGDLRPSEDDRASRDEIGVLVSDIDEMARELNQIVTQVKDASMHVAASSEQLTASADQSAHAAEQIASASQQVSAGAEQQIKSVNQAASSINRLSAGIQQVAANSKEVSSLAENASHASADGVNAVNAVLGQMNEINVTVQETAAIIRNLGARSQEIGNIVSMITDIASQTNLLALNAAIEAARAGEMGRGFAVVADEVRKLAEQSAASAKQIAGLIELIQKETVKAVASMQQGTEKVEHGMEKTRQVSEVFNVIENSVSNVTGKVQEVTAAVQQMSVGSQHILQAMEDVSRAAEEGATANQQNSAASEEQLATMEEVTSSAQSLSRLAEDLQQVLTKFIL